MLWHVVKDGVTGRWLVLPHGDAPAGRGLVLSSEAKARRVAEERNTSAATTH
jgi:hypothetical protein